jgi:hypothetical protein
MTIADCGVVIADCGLRIADWTARICHQFAFQISLSTFLNPQSVIRNPQLFLNPQSQRGRRGFGIVVLMGLIALCAISCGSLLLRSMQIYHASAMGQWRLQARAAAEGAAVLCRQAPDRSREDVRIGDCVIRFRRTPEDAKDNAARDAKPSSLKVILEVETRGKSDQMVYVARYAASYRATPEGKWKLDRLEKAP